MWRYFLAVILTLFFGPGVPGVGHLVIRQYKKAIILILLSIAVVFIMSAYLVSFADLTPLETGVLNFSSMMEFSKKLLADNSDKMFYSNIALAAIWAYALADIIWNAVIAFRSQRNEK
ncbi:hypothetical protein [Endomicrobium proavitum]|uniref:Uncharacterized protein n=1 Tax=Endomicrobium proavitum TaxID=1408281 RepID=A0A0G3WJ63_9BACT|nr:hypothetical protein [Endomicrobium proavitum]AKL97494.1 membrane protein of unknown function [Endomicrobium proavitum]